MIRAMFKFKLLKNPDKAKEKKTEKITLTIFIHN